MLINWRVIKTRNGVEEGSRGHLIRYFKEFVTLICRIKFKICMANKSSCRSEFFILSETRNVKVQRDIVCCTFEKYITKLCE